MFRKSFFTLPNHPSGGIYSAIYYVVFFFLSYEVCTIFFVVCTIFFVTFIPMLLHFTLWWRTCASLALWDVHWVTDHPPLGFHRAMEASRVIHQVWINFPILSLSLFIFSYQFIPSCMSTKLNFPHHCLIYLQHVLDLHSFSDTLHLSWSTINWW